MAPPTKKKPQVKKAWAVTLTPFILGAVCKDWRAITWSTPALWSSMVVHLTVSSLNKRAILVKDWLARSGQLPLSIRIFIDNFKLYTTTKADLSFLAEVINQYSSRWCHFELSTSAKIGAYFRPEASHAPILEYLRLELPGRSPRFELVTGPRLQKVHMTSVSPIPSNLPWNNVTHIIFKTMWLPDILQVFQLMPLLFHAEVVDSGASGLNESAKIVIPLKSLKVLGWRIDRLFSYITCPDLHELVYDTQESYVERSQFGGPSTINFLAASGQLSSFSMLNIRCEVMLVDILRAMPSLKKLVLTSGTEVEELPEILNMVHSSQSNSFQPRFLPCLEIFDYTGPFRAENLYLPVVFSPIPIQYRLRSVSLQYDLTKKRDIPPNTIPFFLHLIEYGVAVKIQVRA